MKVIFLDIDGVLNSWKYDQERGSLDENIDKTRLPLICEIVNATNAQIVLTSTWRKHWSQKTDEADQIGRKINETFALYNLTIMDKTPDLNNRPQEIKAWLCNQLVERFVIIDDIHFGWEDLDKNVVKTNYRVGRGLGHSHVQRSIDILNDCKSKYTSPTKL